MNENRPVIYPLRRLLYSRKVMVALVGLIVAVLGEYGLPEEIVTHFRDFALVIIASWTIKDTAANIANGKK